jgi:hypothetical protein
MCFKHIRSLDVEGIVSKEKLASPLAGRRALANDSGPGVARLRSLGPSLERVQFSDQSRMVPRVAGAPGRVLSYSPGSMMK